jgi:hypothetical protein
VITIASNSHDSSLVLAKLQAAGSHPIHHDLFSFRNEMKYRHYLGLPLELPEGSDIPSKIEHHVQQNLIECQTHGAEYAGPIYNRLHDDLINFVKNSKLVSCVVNLTDFFKENHSYLGRMHSPRSHRLRFGRRYPNDSLATQSRTLGSQDSHPKISRLTSASNWLHSAGLSKSE